MICFSFLISFIVSTQFYYGNCMGRGCLTSKGQCIFPFNYYGISHTICTVDGTRESNRAWCYTHVPFGVWDYCPESCFSNGVSNNVIQSCGQTEVNKKSLAEKHQFPWNGIIGLINEKSFFPKCNAAIVTRRYVLTVASCIEDWFIPEGVVIQIGNFYTRKLRDGQIHQIKRIVKHEDYNRETYTHDIAFVESKTPFIYHDRCLPINLLPIIKELEENEIMTFSTIDVFDNESETLGYSILKKKKCSNQTAQNIICTNSNGILIINNLGGLLTYCQDRKVCKLVGLLSEKEGRDDKFVFINVNEYIPWFSENIPPPN